MASLAGSCQCRRVTYTSASLPLSFTNCHCATCRKISGAPYITFGQFPKSAITFTSASSLKTTSYSNIATRTHCSECGTPISMTYRCDEEGVSITKGSIDEETVKGILPEVKQEIFVRGGAGEVKDGVERYAGFSQRFQERN